MKATRSVYVKYALVVMLTAGPAIVQAQSATNCTISGEPGVYACPDLVSPPSQSCTLYTLDYRNNQLVYDAPGSFGVPTGSSSVGNQVPNVLQLPGFGLTFSKLNGYSQFNHGVFTNHWGTACGTLVDTDNDDLADKLVVQLGAYAGRGLVAPVIADFDINFVRPNGTIYWWLPIPGSWTNYPGPLNFYTPVNQNGVSLSCNDGELTVAGIGQTNARAQGPCAINASIPTATFWGYAAMTLLLMFAGMRLLRKRGFGDDFNLRA